MIEAVKLWNEPNNRSHWDWELDPGWDIFAETVRAGSAAVAEANPSLTRVLGGISPIDREFMDLMKRKGVLESVDVVAVHGFPLDWNYWQIDEWPDKVAEIEDTAGLPVWVTEVGVSTYGANEVQEFGLQRTAELLLGRVDRVHWYSLYDLPKTWEATSINKESEGSAYYRHFFMGLIREDGTPKPALEQLGSFTPELGICQWFHYQDHRLEDAVRSLRRLGVKRVRTGLSWADFYREDALAWFDRQMEALEEFDTTVTLCYTPPHLGLAPHCASPPARPEDFAEFCATMVERYAPASRAVNYPARENSPSDGRYGDELAATEALK